MQFCQCCGQMFILLGSWSLIGQLGRKMVVNDGIKVGLGQGPVSNGTQSFLKRIFIPKIRVLPFAILFVTFQSRCKFVNTRATVVDVHNIEQQTLFTPLDGRVITLLVLHTGAVLQYTVTDYCVFRRTIIKLSVILSR